MLTPLLGVTNEGDDVPECDEEAEVGVGVGTGEGEGAGKGAGARPAFKVTPALPFSNARLTVRPLKRAV